jgi:PKD repeat protein
VLEWKENEYIYVKNLDENGDSRFHRLIPTDLIKRITFDVDTVATGNPNEYTFSISNVEKTPENLEIESLSWDFGDGETMEASGPDASVTHTYMRAGTYTATATVIGGDKEFTSTVTIGIASNHPDYEIYYIDSVMVTYEDFGETSLTDMGVNIPSEASLEKVQNPDDSRYPNRSQYVGKVTKNAGSEVGGALFQLPAGYKFDLRDISTFKVKVYADTAHTITMKLLNSDRGNSAWLSMAFVHKKMDVVEGWQVLEFDFTGVQAGFNQSWADPSQYEPDVTAADRYNHNFYDKIEIVANDGNTNGPYIFYMDDLEGPHVEGLK